MKDALGFDIVLGNIYGYSNRQNGCVKVVIGKAIKFNVSDYNSSTVTLEVIHRGEAVYDKEVKEIPASKSISCTSNTIFPIDLTNKPTWVIS
jgi:hypothetical protein